VVAKFNFTAQLVTVAIAASIAGAAPAQAQPGGDQSCQFAGGLGPNSACASAPEDDYPDIFWPGNQPGYFPRGGMPGIWRGF
jgi:hypothetical protein